MPNAATPAARHTKPSRAIHGNGVSRRTTIGGCGTASGSSDRRRRNAWIATSPVNASCGGIFGAHEMFGPPTPLGIRPLFLRRRIRL